MQTLLLVMRMLRPLQPALAALLAACVLLIGCAAQIPRLHALLCADTLPALGACDDSNTHPSAHAHSRTQAHAHAHKHAHHAGSETEHENRSHAERDLPAHTPDGHVCAVTLFAAGCDTPVPFVLCPPLSLNATRVAHFTEFMLARTLRGPARVCGPPALA